MEKVGEICIYKTFKVVLSALMVFFLNNYALAGTVDWKGGTSTDWATAINWSTGVVPVSTDDVRIGVVGFTNQPIISDARACLSLTFGVIKAITLTVNTITPSPLTGLTVGGDIVQNPIGGLLVSGFSATLAGTGAISCHNFQVGNTTTSDVLNTNNLIVISKVASLNLSANLNIYSSDISVLFVGVGYNNAAFSLQGGTTNIAGQILTLNTKLGLLSLASNASPTFSIDIPTGSVLTPTLTLANASPINSSSVTGSIDFYNNTGGTGTSTVFYNGTAQAVYTSTTTQLDPSPKTYQYLLLTGSGTKTIGAGSGGTLSIAADFTTTSNTVLFNTNNPIVTIGGNWANSSNATQGTSDITVSGSVANNSGGKLNLGTGNLFIAGNYTNSLGGTYTQSTGTTHFNGVKQILTDNSITGTQFNKVIFENTDTAKMTAGTANFSVASTGLLTMVSPSKLVAGSSAAAYLTLKSDTLGSSTVAAIPSGSSIIGFVSVQRFVQGSAHYDAVQQRWSGRNYRLMSSQVNEGKDVSNNIPYSLNYLAASTIITDCTSTFGAVSGNPSLYFYNEHYTPSNLSFISGNFIGITNVSATTTTGTISTTDVTTPSAKIYAGAGFMMYFRGDKVTHILGTPSKTKYPYVAPESVTFNTTGNLNQGSYAVTSWTGTAGLMFTTTNPGNSAVQGYNLVGNPYASSIDWSTFSNSSPTAAIYGRKVDPTIYILNPTTSNFDTYSSATNFATGSASKIIPSGQGFFIHADSAGAPLTFKEIAKTNTEVTGSNLLMGTPQPLAVSQMIRLKLIADSSDYDDIVIGFNASASAKYNGNEDSRYLQGLGALVGLSSLSSDGINLAINFLPFPKRGAQLINLDVEAKSSGLYTLKQTSLEAIPQIYRVWLMDRYLKDSLDIRNNTSYAFNINLTDTASYGRNRFVIAIRQDPYQGIHLLNFTAGKTAGGAQTTWKTENEQNYTNFTVERSTDNGTTFNVLGGFTSNAGGNYSFLDKNPPSAIDQYRVKVQDLNGNVSYTKVIALVYGSGGITDNNVVVYPNPASNVINLLVKHNTSNSASRLSALQNQVIHPDGLTGSAKNNSAYDMKIINMVGLVVKSATSTQSAWQNDITALSPGTYIIQVSDNNILIGKYTFTKL